ncbi:beta-L-arabinofuranosidase domain-containing protein [Actinotalea sp. K2]|uniref:glycoside hydrolase family 127 protein n=1 Tax=Actinotalea sp. K2 TaxID=2939438 RepID=UPI0020182156|nr:beta-L-arabinofuranosidase domain-containing protein [Actinotalea sp. K2]MCL3859824.1 glycoside hydrolase family 127 protein [Actinotalea sp. K2]
MSVVAPVLPGASPQAVPNRLNPPPLTSVQMTGGFWADVQRLNRESIIPHCDSSLERVGWVDNFRALVEGEAGTRRRGREFSDSEIYKTMEAMVWEEARSPSEDLRRRLGEYTELLATAQAEDGYLNTYYGYDGGPVRYEDLAWGHELYCAGHLLQAAVAAIRTGAAPDLVGVARRLADHVCEEFGPQGRDGIDGHPEIETALVELYRATGEHRYLDQARLFVERRGHRRLGDTMFKGRDYYQDDVPVREATVLVGHAVRALYLTAGAIDVAVETGDTELLATCRAQFDRTLERRTYLTGGMGSNHHGETYGEDFELPSERAYAETCAAVASIQVAWRLLLATGDPRYGDVIERTLYNNVVSSPSADGRTFFYVNTLHRRSPGIAPEAGVPSLRRTDGTRAPWYTTSCCPTNVARLVASLGAYLVTTDDTGVQLHQYATGEIDVVVQGRPVGLAVTTGYPYDGAVVVRVTQTDDDPWDLTLRVPGWCRRASLVVGDEVRDVESGEVTVSRTWALGDEVRLELDVTPRWVRPDPRVDHVRGCLAVERGPLVYAAESVDHPGADLDLVSVDPSEPPVDAPAPAGLPDVVAVRVGGTVRSAPVSGWASTAGGDGAGEGPGAPTDLTLIPYYRWANRGSSTMRVWLPRTDVPA